MMENMEKKKMLTGLQPTGAITLGNYIGALREFKKYQEQVIKNSINRPTEQVKLLEELYPDIYYKAISNKHNIGNRNIIQMFGDNAGSHKTKSLPASYQHFNFIGPVGQKGLNFIGWINPTENVEKYLTRQHTGKYTNGLSRKTNRCGGRKSLKNI